jgi:hypothetical protein
MPGTAVDGVTVKVSGLREVQRAFRRMSGTLRPELRAALRKAAEPVARDARAKEKWQGASVSTIGPKVTLAGASVTQRARKVTGARPDYGALQMRDAFIPALVENADEIEAAAEAALTSVIEAA